MANLTQGRAAVHTKTAKLPQLPPVWYGRVSKWFDAAVQRLPAKRREGQTLAVKTFPLDAEALKGWAYADKVTSGLAAGGGGGGALPPVVVRLVAPSPQWPVGAWWMFDDYELRFAVPEATPAKLLPWLRAMLDHESTHMVQTVLQDALGLSAPAGLAGRYDPTRDYMGPEAVKSNGGAPGSLEHFLDDTELYPIVRTEAAVFRVKNQASFKSDAELRVAFEAFIKGRRSFQTWQEHDQAKWRKAVDALWAELTKDRSLDKLTAKLPGRAAAVAAPQRTAATIDVDSLAQNDIGFSTVDEYIKRINPKDIHHSAESYDHNLESLNRWDSTWTNAESYEAEYDKKLTVQRRSTDGMERLLLGPRFSRDGTVVALRQDGEVLFEQIGGDTHARRVGWKEPARRVKYLEQYAVDTSYGERTRARYPTVLQTFTGPSPAGSTTYQIRTTVESNDPEIVILDARGYIVAHGSDEWGATLLRVASEYRSAGLGARLLDAWYARFPAYQEGRSGGLTPYGDKLSRAAWARRVRELLASGVYSELVRTKRMTQARVDEILAGLPAKSQRSGPERYVRTAEPLVYADDIGFIIYDPAIYEVSATSSQGDELEKYVYAHGFLRESGGKTFYYALNFDPQTREQAQRVALQLARDNGETLWVGASYGDVLGLTDDFGGAVQVKNDNLTVTRDVYPLREAKRKEKAVRAARDKYGEYLQRLQEEAEGKDWAGEHTRVAARPVFTFQDVNLGESRDPNYYRKFTMFSDKGEIGFVTYGFNPDHGIEVHLVRVLDAWQRQGMSQRLLNEFKKLMKRRYPGQTEVHSDVTWSGAYDMMTKSFGEPTYVTNGIRLYDTPEERAKAREEYLVDAPPFDEHGNISTGSYLTIGSPLTKPRVRKRTVGRVVRAGRFTDLLSRLVPGGANDGALAPSQGPVTPEGSAAMPEAVLGDWGPGEAVRVEPRDGSAGAYAVADARHRVLPSTGQKAVWIPAGTEGVVKAVGPDTVMVLFPAPVGLVHVRHDALFGRTPGPAKRRWACVA